MIPRVIVGQRVGRLGNQISVLANLLAFSQSTGVCTAHMALREYGIYFAGTSRDPLARHPHHCISKPLTTLFARKTTHNICRALDRTHLLDNSRIAHVVRIHDHEYFDLSSPAFMKLVHERLAIFLFGGWQFRFPTIHPTFFEHARKYFALAEPFASNVKVLTKHARLEYDILIGVHIRQADFKKHAAGRFYISTEAYARLLHHCQDLFPGKRIAFGVVSDEPKTPEDFKGVDCFFGSGVPVEDMYLLGECDYIIGNIASSFCLWPAVLYQRPTYRISDPNHLPTLAEFKATTEPWKLII